MRKKPSSAPPGLFVNFYDRPVLLRSEAPLHRHSTIAATVKYTLLPTASNFALVSDTSLPQSETCVFSVISEYLPIDEADTDFKKLFYKAISTFSERASWCDLESTGHFLYILSQILHSLDQSDIVGKLEKLQPASVLNCLRTISYIYAHVDERIRVEDLTNLLGISKGYLSRIFKNYVGYQLIAYINCVKLNKVASLITDGGLTLKEAGQIVGFTDMNYLSRAFRQYLGTNARNFMSEKFKEGDTKFLEEKVWPSDK